MVTAERNRASNAAAATAAPPFSDTLLTEQIPLARSASLASAAADEPDRHADHERRFHAAGQDLG